MTLTEKLTAKFGDRLRMDISAVQDEGLMRDMLVAGIDRCLGLVSGFDRSQSATVKQRNKEKWEDIHLYMLHHLNDDNIVTKPSPLTAIEIGTYHGVSAALLAEYFSTVHTFDIVKDSGGYWKDAWLPHDVWEFLNISERIIPHIVASDTHKEDIIKHFPTNDIKFDFAFIDGRHKGGVDVDFKMLEPYCDVFLFHDYNPDYGDHAIQKYVTDFVDSIEGGKIVLSKPLFALWVKDDKLPYGIEIPADKLYGAIKDMADGKWVKD